MKKQKFSTRVLAEVAIFAALAFALDALQAGIWRSVFVSGEDFYQEFFVEGL